MTVKELCEKCKNREADCDNCPYEKECDLFTDELEGITPEALLYIMDKKLF